MPGLLIVVVVCVLTFDLIKTSVTLKNDSTHAVRDTGSRTSMYV